MLAVGETLEGRYRILREIGAGGMGTVYEGENLLIRRRVAIKVMRHEAGNNPELCARFEREAQIASQIPSDHITEVLDLGELDGGQRFIVMEYLVGESLSQRLERAQRLPPRELLGLVRQVLSALGAAHRAGVIHRDVKPDNVFILNEKAGRRDFVKLLDFGISKLRPVIGETPLTQSGMFVGTPSYMAPEQVGGGEASPLWDLYAVGVILYRGLTGETPHQGKRVDELVFKVALGKFVPPAERVPDLDPALDALVCRALSRAPEQRFQSAERFIEAIDDWLAAVPGEAGSSRAGSSRHVPLHTPSGIVTSAPPLTPQLPFGALPTTRLTTEIGVPARRSMSWFAWAAAGAAVFSAAAVIAVWRSSELDAQDTLTEVGGLSPQPAAAAPVAPPAPIVVAPVVAAPSVVVVPTPETTRDAPTEGPSSPTVADRASKSAAATPTVPAPTPVKRRRVPARERTRAPKAEAAPPAAPSTGSEVTKPRPDWGY